ncbi:MAG TPA: hypothetical protein VMU40_06695 [Steroidobacteraceae bacterium]|nr:hypothetical protein [Steroidobacteraceae bacterium]
MKTMTKVVLSSAVLAGAAAAAHAQTVPVPDPSTDASELIFIVQNTNTGNTYDLVLNAGVTGPNGTAIGSNVLNAAQVASPGVAAVDGTSPGVIYGDAGFSVNLSGDTALQSFLSTAGSNFQWGVMGGAYVPNLSVANSSKVGNVLIATTGTASSVVTVAETTFVQTIPGDLSTDIEGLDNGTFDSYHGVTNGYPASAGTDNEDFNLYGQGVVQGSVGATSESLYGMTGNGTKNNQPLAYLLGTFTFNGSTLAFTGESTTVPIPAAGWLLGSGLLGLLGISRRRRDLTAA